MASGQLIFQPPTFHWPSEDQQTALKEWQSHVTLTLEVSNIPQERWYASIVGFLGIEGFKRWQYLDISKKKQWEETPWKCVQSLHWHFRSLNIPMELHQWNVQWHQTGWTRNHWSARPMHQDFSQEVWLHVTRREDAMPFRTTLPCHQTLQSQEVGQITDSSEQNSHLQQTTRTCQATQGNR